MAAARRPRRPRPEWTKVVLLPLVTLVISIVGSWYFTDLSKEREARQSRQAQESETRDSKQRLYAQLLTQREQSDATIRKDMFEVVLGRFLSDRQQGNLSDQVLQLELLANNFNQSLDLAPLFKDWRAASQLVRNWRSRSATRSESGSISPPRT